MVVYRSFPKNRVNYFTNIFMSQINQIYNILQKRRYNREEPYLSNKKFI